MRAHADGGGRLNFQNVVGVTLIDNAQMTKQAALIHQPGEARPRQLAQVHFAQRLPGQLHQLGPQAVVILIIHTDEALLFQLAQQQIHRAFRDPQLRYYRRRAAGADAAN